MDRLIEILQAYLQKQVSDGKEWKLRRIVQGLVQSWDSELDKALCMSYAPYWL